MKSIWKIIAYLMAAMLVAAPLYSCGNDDEDEPDAPGETGKRLSSISMFGNSFFTFKYNSSGKITRINSDVIDMTIEVDYSPLTLTIRDEDDVTIFTNVKVNSDGYITQATITETSPYDREETWTTTIRYNESGHITYISDIDDSTDFIWSSGKLTEVRISEEEPIRYSYSSLENKAGVFSPMWDPLGLYWMTGLFGKAPSHFPSRITAEDSSVSLAYKLHTDGTIAAEQIKADDEPTFALTYNYISARSDFRETASGTKTDLPVFRFKSPFKHTKK